MDRRWMVLPLTAWLAMGCALPENQYECAVSACPAEWVCCPGTQFCASSADLCHADGGPDPVADDFPTIDDDFAPDLAEPVTPYGAMGSPMTAVDVAAGYTVDDISDEAFSCALTNTGRVECWGTNEHGQLGNGTFEARSRPSLVLDDSATPLSRVTAIALGGGFACALRDRDEGNPEIWCWGRNDAGSDQLGRSGSIGVDSPFAALADARPSRPYRGLAAGRAHVCATMDMNPMGGRNIECWGKPERLPADEDDVSREAETALSDVRAVFAGYAHTCFIDSDAALWCWGANGRGQLGNNTTASNTPEPQRVLTDDGDPLTDLVQGSAGRYHTCAVNGSGRLHCWGRTLFGRIGDGSSGEGNLPGSSQVRLRDGDLDGERVISVTCGQRHTCANTTRFRAYCWGHGANSELGQTVEDGAIPPNEPKPVLVPLDYARVEITAIAAGGADTCVVDQLGGLRCWGNGDPTPAFVTLAREPLTVSNEETTDDED